MHKTKLIAFASTLVAVTFAYSQEPSQKRNVPVQAPNQVDPANSEKAKTLAQKWSDARTESGFVLLEKFKAPGLVFRDDHRSYVTKTGAPASFEKVNPPDGPRAYKIVQDGYWITISFSRPITTKTTLNELRRRLEHMAIDQLPMGVRFPEGWEVSPRTSHSSFKKGIEILDYRDNHLTIRVKTRLYAVHGIDRSFSLPADSPAPKGAFFHISKDIPLDMTFSAPVQFEPTESATPKNQP